MGFLFGRKSGNKTDERDVDLSHDEDDDDIGSIPNEVTTEGGRGSSSSRSLSRWLTSKKKQKGKEKSRKNNNNKGSSTSTSSSGEEKNIDNGQERHGNGGGPSPSQLQSKITEASNESGTRRSRQQQQQHDDLNNSLCSLPPAAKDAAFEGPTRFDWIDVEYSAVTKIQSIFRRHLVLQKLEEQPLSTSFIRNRRRQRKANPLVFHSSKADEAAPDLGFGCCDVGSIFGGDDEKADSAAYRAFQRKQYEEKAKEQADREEFLRQSYLKQQGRRDSVQIIDESKSRKEVLSRP